MKKMKYLLFLLLAAAVLTVSCAAGEAPIVRLSLGSISKTDTVWFGYQGSSPVSWTVLSPCGNSQMDTSSANEILLISSSHLDIIQFNSDETNGYSYSEARTWCSNFYSRFPATTVEKNAINKTSVVERTTYAGFGTATMSDYLFFLSAKEAETYLTQSGRSSSQAWWLRSPAKSVKSHAGYVTTDGAVALTYAHNYAGARPAFNLNAESILFISSAGTGKLVMESDGQLYPVSTMTSSIWKLTLIDGNRIGFRIIRDSNTIDAQPGGKFTIQYAGAKFGNDEYISVFLSDNNTRADYYASLPVSDSLTAEFTLPADLPEGQYTLKVFNEEKNANRVSDYSSEFTNLTLNVAKVKLPITPVVTLTGWKYGEAANEPNVTGNEGNGAVTFHYKSKGAADELYTDAVPSLPGEYTVRATIEETDDYQGAIATADFTISKADSTVTSEPAAKEGLIADGTVQELVTAGTAAGGVMQYALGSDDNTAPESGWDAAVPKGTDAGTYYVWRKVFGDEYHNDSTAACVTVTIAAPKPAEPEEPKDPENPEEPKDPEVPEQPEMKDKITKNGIVYQLNHKKKTAAVVKVSKKTITKATIPATVNANNITYKVTEIQAKAFKGKTKLTKVSVGKNVITIGKQAFYGCVKLKTVSGMAGVTTIGDSAFEKCKVLPKFTIPAKVKKIGAKAFFNCAKLATITIQTTKLTEKNVGANAFNTKNKKTVYKVPAKKLKVYRKWMVKKGVPDRKQVQ